MWGVWGQHHQWAMPEDHMGPMGRQESRLFLELEFGMELKFDKLKFQKQST